MLWNYQLPGHADVDPDIGMHLNNTQLYIWRKWHTDMDIFDWQQGQRHAQLIVHEECELLAEVLVLQSGDERFDGVVVKIETLPALEDELREDDHVGEHRGDDRRPGKHQPRPRPTDAPDQNIVNALK